MVILRCIVGLNLNWIKSNNMILVKIYFCHAWKCIISGLIYRSEFWYLWGIQLSYFQNGYFAKILWIFHETHNQVKCRYENKIVFWTFYLQNFEYSFVLFVSNQSFRIPIISQNFLQLNEEPHDIKFFNKSTDWTFHLPIMHASFVRLSWLILLMRHRAYFSAIV